MRCVLCVLMIGSALLSGCELIADFDRGKIPRADAGRPDGGGPSDAAVDGSVDTGVPDQDAASDEDAGL